MGGSRRGRNILWACAALVVGCAAVVVAVRASSSSSGRAADAAEVASGRSGGGTALGGAIDPWAADRPAGDPGAVAPIVGDPGESGEPGGAEPAGDDDAPPADRG